MAVFYLSYLDELLQQQGLYLGKNKTSRLSVAVASSLETLMSYPVSGRDSSTNQILFIF